MPGPPVTIGCAVLLTPGAAGPPDSGVVVGILQAVATADGMPLATAGSICQMVNSLSGAPYPLPIGETGASSGVLVDGEPLVRLGDMIPSGPGVLQILGPPAAPYITDENPP
jgi:uncharacterized Zn-binding protein involved in type VI secretion